MDEDLDDVESWGADEGMALLKDMKYLEAGHDEFVMGLSTRVDVPKNEAEIATQRDDR